jgi:outer membrane protein assembly factor BamB
MGPGVFRRRPGATEFDELEGASAQALRVPPENTWISPFAHHAVAADAAGRVYLSDSEVGFRIVNGRAPLRSLERSRGQRFLYDQQDNMWIGTWSEGLWRVHAPSIGAGAVIEKLTALTGLASEGVFSLLEDRDHNIWAGTTDGLTRLVPHKFKQVTALGIVDGLQATPDGSVWVGTFDGLVRFAAADGEWRQQQSYFPGSRVYAMHADRRGTLWASTTAGVVALAPGRGQPVPLAGTLNLQLVTAMTSDSEGALWLCDSQTLVRWKDGREMERVVVGEGKNHVVLVYADRRDRLWLGLTDGTVALRMPDGHLTRYGPGEGLEGGVYRTIFEDSAGVVWLGGDHYGLTRFANGRLETVHPSEIGVTGITEDLDHHLWLRTSSGIATLDRQGFDEALATPSRRLDYTLYQHADGVAGAPAWFGERIAVRSTDGRLWFITGPGLTVIDPRGLQRNVRTPPVRIESIVSDDRKWSAAEGGVVLPAGVNHIEVHYSLVDLTSPQKARFSYHLDGIDEGWVDAGLRRRAFYTKLPPGNYTFQVRVKYGTAHNVATASVPVSIQPRFSQTLWFPALCGAALILAAYGAWRLHIGQVRKRFALVIGERIRLGREIHDTLLQRLAGVALQCDALAPSLTPAPRRRLMRIREQVEDTIRDARQSVWNLRAANANHDDLIRALREAGEQAAQSANVRFALRVGGNPNAFSGPVAEHLLKIGREAIANATRHAAASQIGVELQYEEGAVRLRVVDDGCGFDVERTQTTADGHCGIASMRERAASVDGTVTIAAAAGQGTIVEAVVPTRRPVSEAV